MAFPRTGVGIDIGSHAIKVVQLGITEKGAFLQNALYFDHANLVARGVDPGDLPAVSVLLKAQMTEARIPTRDVVLGIAGADSILRYTSVPPVPTWRLDVIMNYEVGEVAENVGESLASDYRVLPLPREAGDDQVVLVGLCKEEALDDRLGQMEAAGIHVERAVPAPLALFTAHDAFGPKGDPEIPDDDLLVLVDIGRANLNTVLVLNDRLVFARSVSFGGETFTEALAGELGIDTERAEALKEKSGSVDLQVARNEKSQNAVNALRGVAVQLHNLIQSSLRFCRTQVGVDLPEPSRILLLGGGARLRGLKKYLGESFHKPVETFHPHGVVATGSLQGEASRVFASHPGDFAVPVGLAVSGVRESGFSMNILPGRYVERRRFRDRTVFMYAAGILLVLNLICGLIGAWRLNSKADARHGELRQRISELDRMEVEMQEHQAENGKIRERINRILREVEVTSFQALVLDLVGAELQPEIKLGRVTVEANLDEQDTDFEYSLVFEGSADDSGQKAVAELQAFLRRLRSEDRVASAGFLKMEPIGTAYEFEMQVIPAFQTY